jgi:diguanylate cyclase (GGDEF)-like protein/PAS domain S-box-containing protein
LVNQRLHADEREATAHLELLFNTSPDAVLLTRLSDGCFVRVNDGFTALTGYARAEALGQSILALHIWHDPADRARLVAALANHGSSDNLEAVFRRKDGQVFAGLLSARRLDFQGVPHILSVTRDLSAQKQAEAELRASEQQYRLLTESMKDVVWTLDADTRRFLYVSPSVERLRGYTPQEVMAAPLDAALTPASAETIKQLIRQRAAQFRASGGASDQFYTTELEQPCRDGTTVWVEQIASYRLNPANGHVEVRAVTRDITERKRLEDQLKRQATTDAVTGITNRRHFLELAQTELTRALRFNHPLALALIDLDHFKRINDVYGHAAGDAALVTFVQTCQTAIREIDLLARFGGDEFALLLPEATGAQAQVVTERVRRALAALPAGPAAPPVPLLISAGIACLTDVPETLDVLLGRADQALYRVKAAGGDSVALEAVSAQRL